MTTPTPADRLALAVCPLFTCPWPCRACRRISQIYARELATILRERHGSSETADWLDGIGEHQPTEDAPEPEPAGPTSDDLRTMAAEFAARTPEEFARAVLARWGRPAVAPEAGELSPREVKAQEAFTEMRDEILSRSDGLSVNEVLSVIDSFTPDWV